MKILFIGNSYTYFYDLPKLFENVCKENGVDVETDSVTCGGYTLEQFASDDDEHGRRAKELLSNEKYDYVVLLEQSSRPAEDTEKFCSSAKELVSLIRKNGAKPVFYETWGRADWSEDLPYFGWTHEQMQEKLKAAYEKAAKENDAIIVYAGERIHEAYRRGEEVFDKDGSHPSPAGSEIAAREFCKTLFNK